jgi:hypothetical protein
LFNFNVYWQVDRYEIDLWMYVLYLVTLLNSLINIIGGNFLDFSIINITSGIQKNSSSSQWMSLFSSFSLGICFIPKRKFHWGRVVPLFLCSTLSAYYCYRNYSVIIKNKALRSDNIELNSGFLICYAIWLV